MDSRIGPQVDYYQSQSFNPVLIPVEDRAIWLSHVAKRRHLYERHLGVPLSLMAGRRVLEFGCNTGENALVLASFGARFTFVEPNKLVAPRFRSLFTDFGLAGAIEAFHETEIALFTSNETYDLVIAEGFLSTLPNRDEMLAKIIRLIRPGGFGVISFNDRQGGMLEMLKRALLHRAFALTGLADIHSDQALALARAFFEEDFKKLNASRSLETWWRDTLVAPHHLNAHLWSYPELLSILDVHGAVVHGTSPMWSSWEHFNWYKNVPSPEMINQRFLEEWRGFLLYFVTGAPPLPSVGSIPSAVIDEITDLVRDLSILGNSLSRIPAVSVAAPNLLAYLASVDQPTFRAFGQDLGAILSALELSSAEELLACYKALPVLRSQWGTAYHYLCFQAPQA